MSDQQTGNVDGAGAGAGSRARADLMLHPVRMRIVAALAGHPLTPSDLGRELPDVPPATLYRHIRRLAEGGVLVVSGERAVRGATERTYALAAGVDAARAGSGHATAHGDVMHSFSAFLARLRGDLERYLGGAAIDPAHDVEFRQVPLYLTPAETEQLGEAIGAALWPFLGAGPGEGRQRVLLATIRIPSTDEAVGNRQ